MKDADVIVLGAGLVGLASAYVLQRSGRQVLLLDANPGPGLGTSFANGGMVTPSMSDPWNAPGIQWRLLKYLGQESAPLLIRPHAMPQYLAWGLKFLWHSAPSRHARSSVANYALSAYSAQCLRELRKTLPAGYDHAEKGTLQVFRDQKSLTETAENAERVAAFGLRYECLDSAQLLGIEPMLSDSDARFVGGLYYPDDESADSHLLSRALFEGYKQAGGQAQFEARWQGLQLEQGGFQGLQSSQGHFVADQLLVAAGAASASLLAPYGNPLNIRPVKGYTLTVECPEQAAVPSLPVIDHHLHTAVTPLSDGQSHRLRLGGTAEFAGWNRSLQGRRLDNLWSLCRELYPALHEQLDRKAARPWCGFRPVSADGLPYIGQTHVKRVFVNAGHGPIGLTQSAGSAHLIADLMNQTPAAIAHEAYSPLR